jgi:hypothetical protein
MVDAGGTANCCNTRFVFLSLSEGALALFQLTFHALFPSYRLAARNYFLQKLRDAKVECWQRLKAARSLEWYQMMVLRVSTVDFTEFKLKLQEMAEKQKRSQVSKDSPLLGDEGIAGEGKPGLVDPNEPRPVQELRARSKVGDTALCNSMSEAIVIRYRFARLRWNDKQNQP